MTILSTGARPAPAALLAVSNFVAAYAGGSMIRMANQFAELGLLCFLLGTVLGLAAMLWTPRARTHRALPVFTACAAAVGVLVIAALDTRSALLVLLPIYFAAWFLGRAIRTDAATDRSMVVAAVDGAYYAGTLAGLLTLGSGWTFASFLVLNASLLAIAAVLDVAGVRASGRVPAAAAAGTRLRVRALPFQFYAASGALACLTIGTQISIFARSQAPALAGHGAALVASVYAGFAIAAALAFGLRVGFVRPGSGAPAGFATTVEVARGDRGRTTSAWLLAAVAVGLTMLFHVSSATSDRLLVPCLLAAGACMTYEFLALAIVDWLGALARARGVTGLAALAYGITGLSSVPALLLMEECGEHLVWVACGTIGLGMGLLSAASRSSRASGPRAGRQAA